MSKKLSGAVGMPWFHTWKVVDRTNQIIRRIQSRENKELPKAIWTSKAYQG